MLVVWQTMAAPAHHPPASGLQTCAPILAAQNELVGFKCFDNSIHFVSESFQISEASQDSKHPVLGFWQFSFCFLQHLRVTTPETSAPNPLFESFWHSGDSSPLPSLLLWHSLFTYSHHQVASSVSILLHREITSVFCAFEVGLLIFQHSTYWGREAA